LGGSESRFGMIPRMSFGVLEVLEVSDGVTPPGVIIWDGVGVMLAFKVDM